MRYEMRERTSEAFRFFAVLSGFFGFLGLSVATRLVATGLILLHMKLTP